MLKANLVDMIYYQNSCAKFDRIASGKALVNDLNGADGERWYMQNFIFKMGK